MKAIATSVVTLLFAVSLSAQSSPDLQFNGHTLGETAETFFSKATAVDSKTVTRDYCKALLDDPSAMQKYEESKTGANKKDFVLSDVSGCQQVMAVLRGERAQVGARLASELGKGNVLFVAGKLVGFTLFTESPYPNVVADMAKRLGGPGRRYTLAHASGPGVKGTRWKVGGVTAEVFKFPYSDEGNIHVGYLDDAGSNQKILDGDQVPR